MGHPGSLAPRGAHESPRPGGAHGSPRAPLGPPRGPMGPQGPPRTPWDHPPWTPLGPILYTEFLTVQSKNQKNYKNRSRKIGTLIKNEKQKCDLQFAPTGLNEFHIEIPSIFTDLFYTTPGPILGALGGPRPPPGAQNIPQNLDKNLTVRSKIPCTVGPQGTPRGAPDGAMFRNPI